MKIRISNWGVAAVWVLIAFIFCPWFLWLFVCKYPYTNSESVLIYVLAYIILGFVLTVSTALTWACGKYYILTDAGIEHKLFGIRYRMTYWEDIADIALCELPVELNFRFRGLLITRKGCPIYRSDIYLPRRTKAYFKKFIPAWLRGQVFIIRTHDVKNASEILPFVVSHYGKLDYDAFMESGKPYPYPANYMP